MLTVGLLHSVLRTLLLALSASGRSVNGLEFGENFTDNEFYFSVSIPESLQVAHPALYPAIRNEAIPKVLPTSNTEVYLKIAAAALRQNSLEDYGIASTQAYKSIWQIDTVRGFDFLGAPAKDMLVRQKLGASLTKIRKIFTVRKSHDATHVFVLSFSAPPHLYERYNADFDRALAYFRFV